MNAEMQYQRRGKRIPRPCTTESLHSFPKGKHGRFPPHRSVGYPALSGLGMSTKEYSIVYLKIFVKPNKNKQKLYGIIILFIVI